MIFSVFLTIFIIFKAYFELNIALLRQRTRNNFIQALMARDNDTTEQHHAIGLARRYTFGFDWQNECVVRQLRKRSCIPEECRENLRMPRKNLLKLKLPNFESKQPPKTL